MAERAEGLSFTGFRAEEMKHGVWGWKLHCL